MSSHLYTVQTAAKFLGVSPGTIRRWASDKKLKAFKVGSRGDWRFKKEHLQQMINHTQPDDNPFENSQLFERITHAVPAMVAVYHIKTGKYIFVNDTMRKLLGYHPEELTKGGMNFLLGLVHPHDLHRIISENTKALKKANSKKRDNSDIIAQFEYRMKHKDGTYRWLHTDGSVFSRDTKGNVEYVLNISIDITERKERENQVFSVNKTLRNKITERTKELEEKEERLKESEERYRQFIHYSTEGIWRFELEKPVPVTRTVNKQINHFYKYAYLAECNQAMAEMYGFKKPSEIIGARLGDFLISTDKQNIEYLKSFITSGFKLTNVASHEVDKEGNEKYFLNSLVGIVKNGNLIRAWGMQQDVTEQRRTQRELQNSHKQITDVLESMNEGFYSVDYNWRLQYVNCKILEIWNMKKEEVLGKHLWSIFPNAEQTKIYKELHEAAKTKSIRKFTWFSSLVKKWVEIHIYPTEQSISVYAHDVSELKNQKTQLEIILRNIADGITVQKPDGEILYANAAAARLIGFSSVSSLLETPVAEIMKNFDITDEEGKPLPVQHFPGRIALQGKESLGKILRFKVKGSNLERWLIVSATPVFDSQKQVRFAINVFHDVTKLKIAEERLQQSEQKYRTIFETAGVSLWEQDFSLIKIAIEKLRDKGIVDFKKYFDEHPEFVDWAIGAVTVKDVNSATLKLYKARSKKELLSSLHKVFLPETKEVFIGELLAIARGERIFGSETVERTLNGDVIHILFTVVFPKKEDSFHSVLVSIMDITERKKAEKKKDEFIGLASHELKTPITSLKAYTQVLQRYFQKKGQESSAQLLEKMDGQINKLTLLITDLLDVSRIQEGKILFRVDTFDIRNLIEEVTEEMQRTTKKH